MELELERKYKKEDYTIGKLYVNGEYFCDTLEDTDRGLSQDMDINEIESIKIPSKTAIPTGKYKITLDIVSPRYASSQTYASIDGKLPRLLGVKGFDGILIHIGNSSDDTSGCVLVGENKSTGKVLNSKETFFRLYGRLLEGNGDINISIT